MDGAVGRCPERQFHVLPFLRPVINRGPDKAGALAQGFLELGMDIAPLAHPHEGQKMCPAKFLQLAQRQPFELVVIILPDGEQRQEIGIGMAETPVGCVRLVLQIQRTFARILDAQRRCDHEHLPQGLLIARLQNHPADRGIHRQVRQLAAGFREFPFLVGRDRWARRNGGIIITCRRAQRSRPTPGNNRTQFLQ